MRVDNVFYIGEHGFYINMKTGIDMTAIPDADVRAVWMRPDTTVINSAVPVGDRVSVVTGDINITVPQGLLTAAGTYILQVVVRITGGVIASRHIEFGVRAGAAPDLSVVFA